MSVQDVDKNENSKGTDIMSKSANIPKAPLIQGSINLHDEP